MPIPQEVDNLIGIGLESLNCCINVGAKTQFIAIK